MHWVWIKTIRRLPALSMNRPLRIYLDNAATSWPKPEAVYVAVEHAMRDLGAAAGRGVYREAIEAERLVAQTRLAAARLVACPDPASVIFTANGTDSLNLALHGLLSPGDHVVTSTIEHNSVLRPLRFLERARDLAVTWVEADREGFVDPDSIRRAIRPQTRLIALIHVSNVSGAIQPVEEVGRIAAEHEIAYLVDAAQSVGHLPFSMKQIGAQLVAAPGHKGLFGPLGTGLLWVAPGWHHHLQPQRQGGTGSESQLDTQPETWPDRFESGNLNVPAIAGLQAGLAHLEHQGWEAIRDHEQQLLKQLIEGLSQQPGITIHGPRDVNRRCGVVSISVNGYDPQEVAAMLELSANIQVRSGLHCAPGAHRALGTLNPGGTVRFSVGPYNTLEQIASVVEQMGQIAATTFSSH